MNIAFWPVRVVYQHWAYRQMRIDAELREARDRKLKERREQEEESAIEQAMAEFDQWWLSGGKVK